MDNLFYTLSETFSLSWLDYQLLTEEFSYANKHYLYALLLIPTLLIYFIIKELLITKKITLSKIDTSINFNPIHFIRFLSPFFIVLAYFFFIISLARPQKTNTNTEHFTEGIDIILALDISGSMKQFIDFKPNRLEAAKKVTSNFIEGRKIDNKASDNIGLVVFAGEAFSKTPLTTDYKLLQQHLESVSSTDIENIGTAIGNALAVATSRVRESEGKSKIIVLISDGENSAGNIDPTSAAELAYAYGIKVYTIGIGKKGKVPYMATRVDFWGNEEKVVQYQENRFDEKQLKEIAKIGQGAYYRATTKNSLKKVFTEINELEKSKIKSRSYQNFSDFFHIYLSWAIVLLLLWLLLKSTFITNAIYD